MVKMAHDLLQEKIGRKPRYFQDAVHTKLQTQLWQELKRYTRSAQKAHTSVVGFLWCVTITDMGIKLSWSRLVTYSTCPLRYHLRYQRRKKRVGGRRPKNHAFIVGSVVHKALEGWHRSGYESKWMDRMLRAIFNVETRRAGMKNSVKWAKNFLKAKQCVARTERLYTALKIPDNNAMIEDRFSVSLGNGHILRGSIDVYDEATQSIYDLKTQAGKTQTDPRQVMTYAVAQRLRGKEVSQVGFIMPMGKTTLRRWPLSESQVEDHREKLVKVADKMSMGVQPVAIKGSHCWLCEFYGKMECPATRKARRVRAVRHRRKRM